MSDDYDLKDKAIVFHNIINLAGTLALPSILIQPHQILVKYPESSKTYTDKHFLIKQFSILFSEIENALNVLEEVFRISEK